MTQRKLLFIVNPRAGRSKSRSPLFDAISVFSEAGYLTSLHKTSAPGDASVTAAREGEEYDLIVAAGGDGTLNEVITGLMRLEKRPPLGYLPQGSTNDFAASLQISGNPVTAARAIVRNVPRMLDIGQWNERYFVYVASFGAFVKSSYSAPQAAKNALGHFAYILEGMKDTATPYVTIPDRKEAIRYCMEQGRKGDVIVLAGKGHEDYQIIMEKTVPFDEKEIVTEILKSGRIPWKNCHCEK